MRGEENSMGKVKNKEAVRAIKFALFSASAGIIEFISIALLDAITPWRHFYCYLIGLVLSVLWNFTFNRKYTFHSSNNIPKAMFLVFLYYLIFTPLSTIAGDKLTTLLGGKDFIVLALTMLVNFVTEFLFQKYVVFKEN